MRYVWIILLALAPLHAAQADALDLALKLKKYYGRGKYIAKSGKYLTNYRDCRSRGASDEQCQSLAAFCAIQDAPIFGRYVGFFKALGLNQVFKLDCGSQECFQCCYVPGQGCHTSFVGYPVINCNPRYGAGTRDVGLTLITDPDAAPGEACISIPQTCEHIAVCAGPENFDMIRGDIDNGADHPVHAPNAAENRAKFFATKVYAKWCESLDRFHTATERDPALPGFDAVVDVQDFTTGRGCIGWRTRVNEDFPFDWSAEYFAINDAEGALVPAASHRNGLCQLGALRVLQSVPALADRLQFIDSTVWPDAQRDAYLATVPDPDAALTAYAHPIVRDILACNPGVYDYRMLAVPLADEPDPGRVFNGCELGAAPQIELSAQPQEPRGVALTVTVDDSEVGTPHESSVELTVFWGDGRVDQLQVPAGQAMFAAQHIYAQAGRYAVYVLAENTSGLRGFAGLVVQSGAGEPGEIAGPVIVSEVRLVDTIARANTLTGNVRQLFFNLDGQDADTGDVYRMGMSPERAIEFNVDTALGTVVGHNPGAAPLSFITLRPRWRDGFYTGFRGAFLRIGRLELHVFDTATGETRTVELPLAPETVRIFVNTQEAPLAPDQLAVDDMGRLELFLHDRDRLTQRIEIDLPQALLSEAAPGPLPAEAPAGDGQWYEARPDHFVTVIDEPPAPDMGMTDAGFADAGPRDMGRADMVEPADGGAQDGMPPDGAPGATGGGDAGCNVTPSGTGAIWWVAPLILGFCRRRA